MVADLPWGSGSYFVFVISPGYPPPLYMVEDNLQLLILPLFHGEVTNREQLSCAPLAGTGTLETTLASFGVEDVGGRFQCALSVPGLD